VRRQARKQRRRRHAATAAHSRNRNEPSNGRRRNAAQRERRAAQRSVRTCGLLARAPLASLRRHRRRLSCLRPCSIRPHCGARVSTTVSWHAAAAQWHRAHARRTRSRHELHARRRGSAARPFACSGRRRSAALPPPALPAASPDALASRSERRERPWSAKKLCLLELFLCRSRLQTRPPPLQARVRPRTPQRDQQARVRRGSERHGVPVVACGGAAPCLLPHASPLRCAVAARHAAALRAARARQQRGAHRLAPRRSRRRATCLAAASVPRGRGRRAPGLERSRLLRSAQGACARARIDAAPGA